ncbi:peptidoglycan-binding protein [Mycolicibacterium novocastrense]|nr:peptidoglycan-binding protein [Mycolicibacterium novocastrense]
MGTQGLTPEEIAAEVATVLPDKEVVSILDLNVDVDVFLDVASPIDLAVAAQLNVAAPIDAAAAANVLSENSTAGALVEQSADVNQILEADATAISTQDSGIDQTDVADGDEVQPPTDDDDGTVEVGDLATLEGPLLNVNVNVDLDTDLAAPIAGAVAANANVAAPISAAVAANVLSVDSEADALSYQDAVVNQELRGETYAGADQTSEILQGTSQPDDEDPTSGTEVISAPSSTSDSTSSSLSGSTGSTSTGDSTSGGDSGGGASSGGTSSGGDSSSGGSGGDSGGSSGGGSAG